MANAVYYDVIAAVQTAIQGLSLLLPDTTVLPSARVYKRKVLTDRNMTLPAVCVFMPPAGEMADGGTNESDDWGHAVGVAIIAASNQDYELDSDDDYLLTWRQRIRRLFHNVRLAGFTAVRQKTCRWEPAAVIEYGAWQEDNLWVQGGIVRVPTREPRTT